ncbi:MAG: glycogen debranching enzyme family protein [Chloroflexi bacterium]|nr:glycogen debranching enzyme family protein [Chloroflexota bacterium]
MIDFGREICGDLAAAERREWLVTNGVGGYAAGTLAGLSTRRYHGLLVAALQPPLGRTLLLSKLDESATYDGRAYPLFSNRWESGAVQPAGFHHLERFRLEGSTPVWSFACADALLEKRIWMQPGVNTTYIRYDLRRASAPLALSIKALVNYRDYHALTRAGEWRMDVQPVAHGLRVSAFAGATPLYLLAAAADVAPRHEWYRGYFLGQEAYRGLDALDDNLYAGEFSALLQAGESLTLVASTESTPNPDGHAAYALRQEYERALLANSGQTDAPAWARQLVLAADQFIVQRTTPDGSDGRSVIAGYPWFGDWGRDTMIGLPGLALATARYAVAASILRTFAQFVDQGMLPNRFPDAGETPEYNTVDATLWYFEAMRAYVAATGDEDLLGDIFPVLQEMIAWHQKGTRYSIRMDAADGLLYAGETGVQLTWMDAKVGDWVVTPRTGKAVEINALWYNALRNTADFARRLGLPHQEYDTLAGRTRAGFARFWYARGGYCYDVLDGPGGDDPALRPNQLFAVSLPHSPLDPVQQRGVVDVCARHLLTSYGLRSLAADDPAYIGHYGGGPRQRDGAYHQGTVWSWLIGPFVSAHLRVYGDPGAARGFLAPFAHHLNDHGLGSISEIFDGDPPFTPRGCIAQAWGVAELLRVWGDIAGDE